MLANPVRKLPYYLCLFRSSVWVTYLMTVGGCWLAGHQFDWANRSIWLAALTVSLTTAFGNVQNDLMDIGIDAINCPTRPLPSGQITVHTARHLAYALCASALFLAFLTNGAFLLLTVSALTVTWLYNLWAKNVPLLGNLLIAGLCALSLASGYFVFPGAELPLVPMITAFLFVLVRELLATILDHPGDQLGGRRSLYAIWGAKPMLIFCLLLTLLALITAVIPSFTLPSPVHRYYLISILLTSIVPVLLAITVIAREPSHANLRQVSHRVRYVYLSTLVSFLWLV